MAEIPATQPSARITWSRWILAILAALFTVGAFTQFFLVGVSYFDNPARWELHVNVGHTISLFAWLMWIPAVLGKAGAAIIAACLVLAVLFEAQYAVLDFDNGMVNAIHPLNGSIMLVLAFWITLRALDPLRQEGSDTESG